MFDLQLGVWEGIDYKCEVSRRVFFFKHNNKIVSDVARFLARKSAPTMGQGELYVWRCSN